MTPDKSHITSEAADVLYHLVVLLEAANVPMAHVMAELEKREGIGGLAEKAQRR
jgi:phosphoribosyl-ATP pyrophosphohydrolase